MQPLLPQPPPNSPPVAHDPSTSPRGEKSNLANAKRGGRDERIRLNVGGSFIREYRRIRSFFVTEVYFLPGWRFETFRSNFAKYPDTLLATMFKEGNKELLRPDEQGEFFFDRNPFVFQVVLDFYRTGRLHIPPTVSHDMVKEEFDFFQIKLSNEDLISEKLGDRMKRLSLRQAYANHRPVLDRLLQLVFEIVSKAAEEGCRFCSIGSPNAVDIDFLKAHSYLRQSSGRDAAHPFNWNANIVDKEICTFLKEPNTRFLFTQKLRNENFQFTFQPIQSTTSSKNFTISICLWGMAKQNDSTF